MDIRRWDAGCAPAREAPARTSSHRSAMSRDLVRNALDRSFLCSHGLAGEGFHHFPRTLGIGDPFVVELVRARRDAAVAFAGIDHSGIAAMHQLEEMVFGLSGPARVTDQHPGTLSVLDDDIFSTALAERAAIEADDRRVTEIGVDAIESGRVGDGYIDIVRPRHRLG